MQFSTIKSAQHLLNIFRFIGECMAFFLRSFADLASVVSEVRRKIKPTIGQPDMFFPKLSFGDKYEKSSSSSSSSSFKQNVPPTTFTIPPPFEKKSYESTGPPHYNSQWSVLFGGLRSIGTGPNIYRFATQLTNPWESPFGCKKNRNRNQSNGSFSIKHQEKVFEEIWCLGTEFCGMHFDNPS